MLAEQAATWGSIWDEVLGIQRRNPDVRRIAESKTDDPEQAIVELVPSLILLHPAVAGAVTAFCHAIEDEFRIGDGEPVTPGRDDRKVTDAFTADARIVELETKLREVQEDRDTLRARLDRLEAALAVAGGAVASVMTEDDVDALREYLRTG